MEQLILIIQQVVAVELLVVELQVVHHQVELVELDT